MTIRDYTTKISNFNWHQLLSQETPYEISKTVFNRVSIYDTHGSSTFLEFEVKKHPIMSEFYAKAVLKMVSVTLTGDPKGLP